MTDDRKRLKIYNQKELDMENNNTLTWTCEIDEGEKDSCSLAVENMGEMVSEWLTDSDEEETSILLEAKESLKKIDKALHSKDGVTLGHKEWWYLFKVVLPAEIEMTGEWIKDSSGEEKQSAISHKKDLNGLWGACHKALVNLELKEHLIETGVIKGDA